MLVLKGVLPMNERGSTSFFGIGIIMVCALLTLFLIKKRIDMTKKNEALQKILLCAKESNGQLKEFFDQIETSNKVLKALTVTEYSSTAIPIYGVVASKSAAQAKKVIKGVQIGFLISYLNNLRLLAQKECYLTPLAYRTPFELQLTGFKRNQFDEAKRRGDTWNYSNLSKTNIITNKVQLSPNWKIESSLINRDLLL